jgi:hypothetical protein
MVATMAPPTATAGALGSKTHEHIRSGLERALSEADADERLGPLLGASGLRIRFEFTDTGLDLNVASGEDGHNISWSFGAAARPARLVLAMPTAIANRFLQGSESLPIAIVRGQVRCSGESRAALHYLPATRLLGGTYRRVVERDFPDLLVA